MKNRCNDNQRSHSEAQSCLSLSTRNIDTKDWIRHTMSQLLAYPYKLSLPKVLPLSDLGSKKKRNKPTQKQDNLVILASRETPNPTPTYQSSHTPSANLLQ